MITTSNQLLAEKLSRLRGYYFSDEMHFWHKQLAWNLRMSSLQAALGLAQLERLDELIKKRRANARYYNRKLSVLEKMLILPKEKENTMSIYWMYGIVLKAENKRDALMQYLEKNGVETRTFFFPMHWQPIYKEHAPYPTADYLGKNGLYLPSSSQLTNKEKDKITNLIRNFFTNNHKGTQ